MSLHDVTGATTCEVTMWTGEQFRKTRPCGQPAVLGALCEKHASDRARLAGAYLERTKP